MQGRRRLVGERTLAAETRLWQRLQREQHRGWMVARRARLLSEDRQRARLIEQRTVALAVRDAERLLQLRQPLRLGALPTLILDLARLDEIELQTGRLQRASGACDPFLRKRNVCGGEKPAARRSANLFHSFARRR